MWRAVQAAYGHSRRSRSARRTAFMLARATFNSTTAGKAFELTSELMFAMLREVKNVYAPSATQSMHTAPNAIWNLRAMGILRAMDMPVPFRNGLHIAHRRGSPAT